MTKRIILRKPNSTHSKMSFATNIQKHWMEWLKTKTKYNLGCFIIFVFMVMKLYVVRIKSADNLFLINSPCAIKCRHSLWLSFYVEEFQIFTWYFFSLRLRWMFQNTFLMSWGSQALINNQKWQKWQRRDVCGDGKRGKFLTALALYTYPLHSLQLMINHFYRTRVRSLAIIARLCLSLTNWLTHWVLFSKLDWCDPGMWRWWLKTCWGCYCCWC